jgi:hypothetical protein
VQGYLKAVGINAKLVALPIAAIVERSLAGRNPMELGSWGSYSVNDVCWPRSRSLMIALIVCDQGVPTPIVGATLSTPGRFSGLAGVLAAPGCPPGPRPFHTARSAR